MALSDQTLTVAEAVAAVADQIPQLRYEIIQNVAQNDPYANVMLSGTVEANAGDTVKTLVPDRVNTGQSLTVPVFEDSTTVCGKVGPQSKMGSTEFSSKLQTTRGESEIFCVKGARVTVEQGYDLMVQGLKDGIKDVMIADNRAQLLINSGLKYVAQAGGSVDSGLSGGENEVAANFAGGLPTAPMTFEALLALSDELRYNFNNIQQFDSGAESNFRVVVGSQQANAFRNEASTIADFRAAVSGGNADAKNALWSYAFQPLFRGLRVGIDPRPLRFNTVDGNGFPVLIEPFIAAVSDHGTGKLVINPAWKTALYEVGFLLSKGTFRRSTPSRYIGEGDLKFSPAFAMGDLQLINGSEIPGNKYKDFAQFIYEIERMIQPVRPHGCIPFTYSRCARNLGLAACPSTDVI